MRNAGSGLNLNEFWLVLHLGTVGIPAGWPDIAPQAVHERPNANGPTHKMPHAQWTGNFDRSNPMQGAAGGTAALRAVRRPAEDAGLDARLQIRGNIDGHFGEQAVLRIAGRMQESLRYPL